MKHKNIMKDPYYAGIMLGIEVIIHEHDKTSGSLYNDSLVKSALNIAVTKLKGKEPKNKPRNDKERFKDDLSVLLRDDAHSLEDIPIVDYIRAIGAVEDSLKIRRSHHGTSRGYLDFLGDFVAKAGEYTDA